MIFGRKKRTPDEEPEEVAEPVADEVADEVAEPEQPEGTEAERQARIWDEAFARDEGPFDISEVDLDADDVKRLDFGSLIATPFESMTMQLQVNRDTNQIQSILVGDGASGLEVAVFAGPAKSSMAEEVRSDIVKSTLQQGGQIAFAQGPFGTELRRRLPVKDPQGNAAVHVSRTWLVPGPGWLLRGVLLGKATFEPDNQDAQVALFEFFSNLVVRRGSSPAVPGSLLPMRVPEADAAAEG